MLEKKYGRQKEKGTAEDEMIRYHNLLSGHEFEQTLLEIMEDRGAWSATIHGVARSLM